MRTESRWTLVVALSLLWPNVSGVLAADNVRSNPRAGIDFYLQTYGRVPRSEEPAAYAVFDKVSAVADKSSLVSPQLVIVGDTQQASAFSLSDGTIFLSKKALSIIRDSATAQEAHARLAFVLGHELAHLANNDFWDNHISQALLDTSIAKELAASGIENVVDTSAGQQKKELKADDQGFVYAALAGYRVDGLLATSRGNEDFLSFWNAKTGKRNDASYPSAEQRTGLLRVRLGELRGAIQNFDFGVRLMHFGRYREAIVFFREFQKQFPSRELFNNLGYCRLRLAVAQLDPDYAYRYWLPMQSDVDSALEKLTYRSAGSSVDSRKSRMSESARESLLQAVSYFEMAIEKDARYAPSYVNLAITQLLLGMDSSDTRIQGLDGDNLLHAKIAVNSALKLQANDIQLQTLASIIDFESQVSTRANAKVDRSSAVSSTAAELISAKGISTQQASDPTVLYNLAQLTRNDLATSGRYWRELARQFDALPRNLQALVCRRHTLSRAVSNTAQAADLSIHCERKPATANVGASLKLPWPVPVKLSRDLIEHPFSEAEIRQQNWNKTELAAASAFDGPSNTVVAPDNIVSLIVLKGTGRADSLVTDSLIECCAQPREKIPVVNGSLWHYGQWIALVRESKVEEIWISN